MNNINILMFTIAPIKTEEDLNKSISKYSYAVKCICEIQLANSIHYRMRGWEWHNPPVYAEALLNKALFKYGFMILVRDE